MRDLKPTIDRRAFTIAAGAGIAAAAVPGEHAAQEATPAAGVEHFDVTGIVHPFSIGSYECLAISDGSAINTDPNDIWNYYGLLFGASDPDDVQAALEAGGYDTDRLIRQDTPLVIDTGEHVVVIDTGIGGAFGGAFLRNLEGAGIAAGDVDVVVSTHGHPDHIGGNTAENGEPAFPNARHVMAQDEWDFWTDAARVEGAIPNVDILQVVRSFVETQMLPVADRYDLVGYDEEIVPGMTSIASPGHTPGHMPVLVQSGGETLWVAGDAITHPVGLSHPELVGFSDTDPETAIATRRSLLQRMAEAGGLALCFHFHPFPGLGHVVADAETWRWEPIATAD